jgi:hypothetical protein
MKNNIIAIFNEVRDIPFRIPVSPKDALFDCAGKSIILRERIEKIGIKTRFGVCFFYWDELNLPDKVKNITHDKDCTHTFVEAFINDKWIKLDPSWDNALSKEFKISHFDGENDTILAVKPAGIFDPEKSQKIMKNQEDNYNNVITDDLARNGKFYEAINKYLEEIRAEK